MEIVKHDQKNNYFYRLSCTLRAFKANSNATHQKKNTFEKISRAQYFMYVERANFQLFKIYNLDKN